MIGRHHRRIVQHSQQPILIPPDSPANFQATHTAALADLHHRASGNPLAREPLEENCHGLTRVVELEILVFSSPHHPEYFFPSPALLYNPITSLSALSVCTLSTPPTLVFNLYTPPPPVVTHSADSRLLTSPTNPGLHPTPDPQNQTVRRG